MYLKRRKERMRLIKIIILKMITANLWLWLKKIRVAIIKKVMIVRRLKKCAGRIFV